MKIVEVVFMINMHKTRLIIILLFISY